MKPGPYRLLEAAVKDSSSLPLELFSSDQNEVTLSPFDRLPDELLIYILSYLNAIKDIPFINLISHRFANLIIEMWRNLIIQYFPYLKENYPDEYIEKPKFLFMREYTRFQKRCQFEIDGVFNWDPLRGLNMKLVLMALKGSIEEIENEILEEKEKTALYNLANANAHTRALIKINDKSTMLSIAVINGNLAALRKLFGHVGSEITSHHKEDLLRNAARHGHMRILQWLSKQCPDLSDDDKNLIVSNAAAGGQLELIKFLYTTLYPDLFIRDAAAVAGEALFEAAYFGHMRVVKWLLSQFGTQISARQKRRSINIANRNQHFEISTLINQYEWQHATGVWRLFTPLFSRSISYDSEEEKVEVEAKPKSEEKERCRIM